MPYQQAGISDNFIMKPYKKGVKIISSKDANTNVKQLFSQEFNSYLLDNEGRTLKMNNQGAVAIGFDSEKEAIGHTILRVSNDCSGRELLQNCLSAIHKEQIYTIEENQVRLDGCINAYLTFKMPCYNESNQLFGLYGCSIILGKHPLLPSLNILSSLLPGINFSSIGDCYNNALSQLNLSLRQQQCLLLAIRGKTAKESSKIMKISHRTIEEYLYNARLKMGASSKKEMIDKAIALLLPNIF